MDRSRRFHHLSTISLTNLQNDNDEKGYLRRMRHLLLVIILLWVFAGIAIPIVVFLRTRNSLSFDLLIMLVLPIYALYRSTKFLFFINFKERKLATLQLQPSKTIRFPAASLLSGKRLDKRHWLILLASIVAVVSIIASLRFLIFLGTSQGSGSIAIGTQTTQSGSPLPSLTSTPNPSGTLAIKPSPTAASNLSRTPGPTVTPTLPSTPTVSNSPTPMSTPTPQPAESLTVYFTNPNGTQTPHAYQGSVTVSISGIGQTSQNQWSDAFYRYTNTLGTPSTSPGHPSCSVLWINDEDPVNFGQLPEYNSEHTYTFHMTAPGGTLNFKVCDSVYSNNTGWYTITLTQN